MHFGYFWCQHNDTKVTAEPESPMHGLLLAEVDTIHESEEGPGNNALPYPRDDISDAEKVAQFIVVNLLWLLY